MMLARLISARPGLTFVAEQAKPKGVEWYAYRKDSGYEKFVNTKN
jgi:hypothetical protein